MRNPVRQLRRYLGAPLDSLGDKVPLIEDDERPVTSAKLGTQQPREGAATLTPPRPYVPGFGIPTVVIY